ncbi:C40 family peptidase [uncultured Corynebacterium sp.]|uniref:C40 family peptidase n=1 Tax=uncultured Corynebacterium sp. TaxID=159447 RepID=UPI0025E29C4D|nr:C40 family peptidase [uncultured Corynebacterium sp.]
MQVITDALRQIASLQPGRLPQIPHITVPDMGSVLQLAQVTGGSPEKVLTAARTLASESTTIEGVQGQARTAIESCIRDLIALGTRTLAQAAPVALGLLVPHPGAKAAAQAMLQAIARNALMEAGARIQQLLAELMGLARPLLEIAARTIHPAISPAGQAATQSLHSERALTAAPASTPSGAPEVRPAALAAPAPDATSAGSPAPSGEGSAQGKAAVQAALSRVGTPYAWGGTGNGGFDCSGLTQWAYRQAGIELPRLAQEQTVGMQVSASDLQPGDLVVWDGHVAMYAGDGTIVEAGDPVQTNPLRTSNMGMTFKGFWRPAA